MRIVGPAVTVRNVPQELDPLQSVTGNDNRMTEIEGINAGDPGDVLVIQGLRDTSNMGGIMASLAKRQGLAGAVVDGGVRDVGQSRRIGFPVWSRDVSPITGKWRCVTVEVNGTVNVAGIAVRPGDLVIADETGTCFVPQQPHRQGAADGGGDHAEGARGHAHARRGHRGAGARAQPVREGRLAAGCQACIPARRLLWKIGSDPIFASRASDSTFTG